MVLMELGLLSQNAQKVVVSVRNHDAENVTLHNLQVEERTAPLLVNRMKVNLVISFHNVIKHGPEHRYEMKKISFILHY